MSMLRYAEHTPTHIATFCDMLIARLPTPQTPVVLCTSLPEQQEPGTRYLCLGSDILTPQPLPALITCITSWMESTPTTLALGHGWALNTLTRSLTHSTHDSVMLTELEGALMEHLARASGQELDRDTLMRDVWHYEPGTQTHTLETHLYRLRGKLEAILPPPCAIETTSNGYRLVVA